MMRLAPGIMKTVTTCALAAFLCGAMPLSIHAAPRALYVAPNGNDASPGSREKPLASLAGARDRVRELLDRSLPKGDIVVEFQPGTYLVTAPVEFSARDSGRDGHRIVYRCTTPGTARFVGGRRLTGWTRHDKRVWRIAIEPELTFHTLYEGGKRVRKARLPNYRFHPKHVSASASYFKSTNGSPKLEGSRTNAWLVCRKQDVDLSAIDKRQLRINVWPWGKCDWQRYIFRVVQVDPASGRLTFDPMGDRTEIKAKARYFLEDSMSFLDAPGEFFLDREKDTLFYIPLGKGHPDGLDIVAPVTMDIVRIAGESRDSPVRDLVFEGFSFEVTDGISPRRHWWHYRVKGANHALVRLESTERIEFHNCHFKNSGCSGLFMSRHNVSNVVTGCWIEQMGVNGITLCNWVATDSRDRKPNKDRLEYNILTNNKIHDVGQLVVYAACVNLMCGSHNQVSHSEFFNSPRYAVTMRGNVAGQHGPERLNWNIPPARGNVFEYLDAHDLGHDSGDMGGLHTATLNLRGGEAVNTFRQITVNRVYAVPGMEDYPPDGIFLDWPSRSMHQVFENVWIRNVQGRQIRTNGRENRTSAVTRNVRWEKGFDASSMQMDRIGLLPGFPKEYGGAGIVVAPTAVVPRVTKVTDTSISLSWKPVAPGARYEVSRDGVRIQTLRDAVFEDTGLREKTKYVYQIRARTSPADALGAPVRVDVETRPDAVPPRAGKYAFAVDNDTVCVAFSETMDKVTVERAGNYRLLPEGKVREARLVSDGRGVVLTVSGVMASSEGRIRISGVRDASSARNQIREGTVVPVRTRPLLAHYTFDRVRDGKALDAGRGGFHGTLVAGATVENSAEDHGVLKLDGKGAHVRGPVDVNLDTIQFTVTAWIRKSDTRSRIVLAKGNGFQKDAWSLGWVWPDAAHNIAFRAENRFVGSRPGSVPGGKWTHVAFTRIGDIGRIYIDGALSGEAPGLGNKSWSNDRPLLIGRRELDKSPAFFQGLIDDVRLYKCALTPGEIAALFQSRQPGETP